MFPALKQPCPAPAVVPLKKNTDHFLVPLAPCLHAPGPLPSPARRAAPLLWGPGRAYGVFATAPVWGLQMLAIWLKRLETFPLFPCHLCVCVCARVCAAPSPAAVGSGRGAAAAARRGRRGGDRRGGQAAPELQPSPHTHLATATEPYFIFLSPKRRERSLGVPGGVFVPGIRPHCGGEGREGAPGTRIASFPPAVHPRGCKATSQAGIPQPQRRPLPHRAPPALPGPR